MDRWTDRKTDTDLQRCPWFLLSTVAGQIVIFLSQDNVLSLKELCGGVPSTASACGETPAIDFIDAHGGSGGIVYIDEDDDEDGIINNAALDVDELVQVHRQQRALVKSDDEDDRQRDTIAAAAAASLATTLHVDVVTAANHHHHHRSNGNIGNGNSKVDANGRGKLKNEGKGVKNSKKLDVIAEDGDGIHHGGRSGESCKSSDGGDGNGSGDGTSGSGDGDVL